MQRIFKLLFIAIIVIALDSNLLFVKTHFIVNAHAADQLPTDNDMKNLLAYDNKASNPECGTASAAAITAATAFIATTISAVIAYAASAEFPPMLAIAVSLTAAATLTLTQNMLLFACKYSFVRHPVLRDLYGNLLKCSNPKLIYQTAEDDSTQIEICPNHQYIPTGQYEWPKNSAPYSDFIEFCHREALGGVCVSNCSARLDPRELETEPSFVKSKASVGGSLSCAVLRAGEKITMHSILFGAYYEGDKICVKALGLGDINWWPQPKIGCHLREPSAPSPLCKESIPIRDSSNKITSYDNSACMGCYISNACVGTVGSFSHAPLPMTSLVVQCLKESMSNILNGCSNTKEPGHKGFDANSGFLNIAKERLRDVVKAVLAIAVMLFGIKAALGAISSYKEVMLFIVKLALVIYFSIGNGMNYYYNELINLSLGLSNKILQGSSDDVCKYYPREYTYASVISGEVLDENESKIYRKMRINNSHYDNIDNISQITDSKNFFDSDSLLSDIQFGQFLKKLNVKNYGYLSIWDSLDCRIAFYLGQSINQGLGYSLLSVLLIIPAFLFAGQIIITIVVLLFVIVLMMMVIWTVHIFILSLIALTILVLFAPLFIPMCLFQATQGFFNGWLKELMTYTLYPVIIFAFLGIVFATFDKLYFDDLKFERVEDKGVDNIRTVYNYKLNPDDQCKSRLSNLACIVTSTNFVTKPLIFGINVTSADVAGDSKELWTNFAILALMGFFFWHFMKTIGYLTSELVGNFRANIGQNASDPTAMTTNLLASGVSSTKALVSKINGKDGSGKDDDEKKKNRGEGVSGGSGGDNKKGRDQSGPLLPSAPNIDEGDNKGGSQSSSLLPSAPNIDDSISGNTGNSSIRVSDASSGSSSIESTSKPTSTSNRELADDLSSTSTNDDSTKIRDGLNKHGSE